MRPYRKFIINKAGAELQFELAFRPAPEIFMSADKNNQLAQLFLLSTPLSIRIKAIGN
jgi:hypothetical protein